MAGTLRPEMAVTRCFFWTMDFAEASKYALVHAQVQHQVSKSFIYNIILYIIINMHWYMHKCSTR